MQKFLGLLALALLVSGAAQAGSRTGKTTAAQMGSWVGQASFYSGNKTASGARYHANAMTAAHRTLPFGTPVKVTNLDNGRTAVVVINDRGPFIRGRVIDLSLKAAHVLAFQNAGTARVRVETVRN